MLDFFFHRKNHVCGLIIHFVFVNDIKQYNIDMLAMTRQHIHLMYNIVNAAYVPSWTSIQDLRGYLNYLSNTRVWFTEHGFT